MKHAYDFWSTRDDDILRRMIRAGATTDILSQRLGRSPEAIEHRWRLIVADTNAAGPPQ